MMSQTGNIEKKNNFRKLSSLNVKVCSYLLAAVSEISRKNHIPFVVGTNTRKARVPVMCLPILTNIEN